MDFELNKTEKKDLILCSKIQVDLFRELEKTTMAAKLDLQPWKIQSHWQTNILKQGVGAIFKKV